MDEENEEGETTGYSAAFAKLHNAALVEPEVLPSINDTSRYLAESIGRYSQVLLVLYCDVTGAGRSLCSVKPACSQLLHSKTGAERLPTVQKHPGRVATLVQHIQPQGQQQLQQYCQTVGISIA